MDMARFDELAGSYPGVRRRRTVEGLRWECRGRLIARQLDDTHVVVRASFDVRDMLLHQAPDAFSVPNRFAKHMLVVADLEANDGAVEDALAAAVRLQTSDY